MFEWSVALVLPIILFGCIIAYGIRRIVQPPRFKWFITPSSYWVFWGVIIAILQGLVAFGTYEGREVENQSPPAAGVIEQFGLEDDRAYPLILGTRTGGTYLEAHLRAGFFSASAHITAQPSSSFPVKFTTTDPAGNPAVYTLEVPMSLTTVRLSDNDEARIAFHLSNSEITYGVTRTRIGEDCSLRIVNLFLVDRCETYRYEWSLSSYVTQRGLGPLVQDGLVGAELWLPEELYAELIGQLN